jgi:hypothetical protein
MLFSGRSNPALAAAIAARLGIGLGAIELETFANDETYCRFGESVRGADVFLLQSCSPPVNDRLVELLLMIDAARLASAHRITAVMPWFPYSRQDRKSSPREPISARLVAEVVEAAGAGRVLTMDLHAGQIQGFFRVPVDHMTALPLFAERFHRTLPRGEPLAVVSPDLGRVKLARRLAGQLGAELAVVVKTRPAHDVAEATWTARNTDGTIVLTATAFRVAKLPWCPGHANEPRNQVVGTALAETLVGTQGRDVICGGGGNDALRGLGGDDLLKGEAGTDRLVGGGGRDFLLGGAGRDTLVAKDGRRDVVDGGTGRDGARVDGRDAVRRVERLL